MSKKTLNWVLAFAYVGFIYLTLSYVRTPLNFLREQGLLVLSLNSIFSIIFFSLLFLLFKLKLANIKNVTLFFLIIILYFLLSLQMSSPEEQIHFVEYGLVGVLFVRALASHWGYKTKSFVLAFTLASAAGWLDEIIQGILPNRHYDPKDILWNIISVFLGLLLFGLFRTKPRSQSHSPS